MTSFKFNFSGDETISGEDHDQKRESNELQWLESEEITPNAQIKELDNIVVHAKLFTYHDLEIGHVMLSEALANIKDSGLKNIVKLSENEHSDLVASKYEGGLKIWECTYDLIEYLLENQEHINIKGAKVLDLGCGAGILGIYAFMNGAFVTFQDYNKEVLEYVTIPNVLLNIEEEEQREKEIKKCKFYSGDWASFNKNLKSTEKYDFIFTSETIYNENNYEKLINIFQERLNEGGTVYVAAKTCYFGVGGSTRQFEHSMSKVESMKTEICWKSTGGIQREILKITRK